LTPDLAVPTITRRPHLIVLDEPTNHLDLPSIEFLVEFLGRVGQLPRAT
jgi:ATPase subunit of ABC transporter with duplicated ATPase domains